MSFPNLYYKRTAAAAKVCYICYKPTTTVLATIDTTDFLYTCTVHLSDRGFATRAPDLELAETKKIGASPEEIAKVKEEWEVKQRQKKEKERAKKDKDKDQEKGTEGKDKDNEADDGKKAEDSQEKKPEGTKAPSASSSGQSTPASRPTHERYILHRDIFALRAADHRRRRQLAQVKDLAPRLPGAPRGTLS
ncbi:DUF1742-domain-containing protein [Paxillus ammoniavirescens]|nr:DUF1742-domain-containing protein [Paxillus ammoniavirescens]